MHIFAVILIAIAESLIISIIIFPLVACIFITKRVNWEEIKKFYSLAFID